MTLKHISTQMCDSADMNCTDQLRELPHTALGAIASVRFGLLTLVTQYVLNLCHFIYDAEKSHGKDKESESLKQTKDRPKRLADKSNVDQQKEKSTDGRYVYAHMPLYPTSSFVFLFVV